MVKDVRAKIVKIDFRRLLPLYDDELVLSEKPQKRERGGGEELRSLLWREHTRKNTLNLKKIRLHFFSD